MQDVYKNVKEYNPDREREVFNVFHLMIADMINKNVNQIVAELFIGRRNLSISLVFIAQ